MKNSIKNQSALFMAKCTVVFFSLLFLLTSCSNDDDSVSYSEQNPLEAYLTASGFDQETYESIDLGDYEFGLSFKPTVTGRINAIVVKIPVAQQDLRVTIWDASTEAIVRTEVVDVASAGVETIKEITPLQLEKDKEYAITMNSNDWYEYSRTDEESVTYPITAGNIQITSYGFAVGTAQVFPSDFYTDYYAGDLSFQFQRTE